MPTQINPATEDTGKVFPELDARAIETALAEAEEAYRAWRTSDLTDRTALLTRIAEQFEARQDELAGAATFEMGKPLAQARAEVAKCATAFRYYAEHGPALLTPLEFALPQGRAMGHWLPQGPILAVMPWNFPYWQVVRFLAPTIMAGNVGLLKHASLTPECAALLEETVAAAGAPRGLFRNLHIPSNRVEAIVADRRVAAVTLTGSEAAGAKVAEAAGRNLKKAVLELGGSDPFIVMPSADVEQAAQVAVQARLQNAGQSCICAKRMIVHADVYDTFMECFVEGVRAYRVGDPLDEATQMGPLSSVRARDDMVLQVERAEHAGARRIMGGQVPDRAGAWMMPAILADLPPNAPVAREEFFGPVAMVSKVHDFDEAVTLANDVPFGLGSSVWTNDPAEETHFIRDLEAGITAVNRMVVSDPHVPFGGVKRSGHGRELSAVGLHEFMNLKSVML